MAATCWRLRVKADDICQYTASTSSKQQELPVAPSFAGSFSCHHGSPEKTQTCITSMTTPVTILKADVSEVTFNCTQENENAAMHCSNPVASDAVKVSNCLRLEPISTTLDNEKANAGYRSPKFASPIKQAQQVHSKHCKVLVKQCTERPPMRRCSPKNDIADAFVKGSTTSPWVNSHCVDLSSEPSYAAPVAAVEAVAVRAGDVERVLQAASAERYVLKGKKPQNSMSRARNSGGIDSCTPTTACASRGMSRVGYASAIMGQAQSTIDLATRNIDFTSASASPSVATCYSAPCISTHHLRASHARSVHTPTTKACALLQSSRRVRQAGLRVSYTGAVHGLQVADVLTMHLGRKGQDAPTARAQFVDHPRLSECRTVVGVEGTVRL